MNELLKFITCGSVDDGKSTLIGHILYDSKLLYADQEQALLLDSQVGSRAGKIDYSLLLDGLMAEREQGITIDVAYRYFTTEKRSFIVADTPGHEEYTRNMAVGASFADLAVILVDASQGVLVQTRRHARICKLMGIRHFVFAVNKMDLIDYEESTFNMIQTEIIALSETLGLDHVKVIPLSATEGYNVTRKSDQMQWYKGAALLPFLEDVNISGIASSSPSEAPVAPVYASVSSRPVFDDSSDTEFGFYMPVQRVCRPDHTFRGFQGQIEAGHIKVGDEVQALPSGETAIVKTIHLTDRAVDEASIGEPVTIQLDREVDVSRGCVIASGADLTVSKSLLATLLWMDDEPLAINKEYLIKIGTKQLPCIVSRLDHKVDVNTGEKLEADQLHKNEIGLCEISLSGVSVIDKFELHKTLGELILIDRMSHATAAGGVVEDVTLKTKSGTTFVDAEQSLSLAIFDTYVFDENLGNIIRKAPESKTYQIGENLPLSQLGYDYPADFDVYIDDKFLSVRDGKFAGIANVSASACANATACANVTNGADDETTTDIVQRSEYPAINEYGIGLSDDGSLQPFATYRTVIYS
ncbi:MAG: sulfate adenylyltransferase [Clostridiales Family XIII bacterium]|nr:sulfate adenylyltransferase [Clostridiales Family XIII bacterium]